MRPEKTAAAMARCCATKPPAMLYGLVFFAAASLTSAEVNASAWSGKQSEIGDDIVSIEQLGLRGFCIFFLKRSTYKLTKQFFSGI